MNNRQLLLTKAIIAIIVLFSLQSIKAQPFTEQTGISLTGIYGGNVAWGDYNNDGYLDILMTGNNITKVYKNNGSGNFVEQTGISLPGLFYGNVAWGDYDNDGSLDILLTGNIGTTRVAKIYHNNANGIFAEQTSIILTGIDQSSVAWGDYNNDGFPDILLTGMNTDSTYITKIYRNNGDNTFTEQTNISLTGITGSIVWGDYNNDDYLDILLVGYTGWNYVSKIYRNNGDNTFTEQTGISLITVDESSIAWGDYDNDGYQDILLTGLIAPNTYISKIYHNTGNNSFTEQTNITLMGVEGGSISLADYDNDGNLDILLTGYNGSSLVSKIYHNNGNNTFTDQTGITLPGVIASSVAWGDYNNDSNLDLFLTGSSSILSNIYISKIYHNDITIHNTTPDAPTGLNSTLNGANITLKWNSVRTDATPYKSMSYNVRVGTAPGISDIVNPQTSSTGFRRVVAMGNAQLDTTFILKGIKKGTYYWSVQAVDNSFAGGAFGTEQTFVYNNDIQAKNVTFSNIKASSVLLQSTRGNGDKRIIFAKENGQGTALPVNGTTFTANTAYGSGTQIGTSGWYCVYNGLKDSVTVIGLKANVAYTLQVIEYTGAAGSEVYYTETGTNNPGTIVTNGFTEQTGTSLPGVYLGSVAWGDYDNDGYLDLLITGNTGTGRIAKIFRNSGNGTFTEQTGIALTPVDNSAVAWGDYNNDGFLDILLTGNTGSAEVTKVYKNNGVGTFTEQSGISLPGIFRSAVAWIDFDNDGWQDIFLLGQSVCKLYRNNGNNTFAEQIGIGFLFDSGSGGKYGSVCWGDYNKDGYPDVIISKLDGLTASTKLYRNTGNYAFTEQTSGPLDGVFAGSVAFGDYNNDGFPDLLLVGTNGSYDLSEIYQNNKGSDFTLQSGIALQTISYGSGGWGDIDNNGNLDILLSDDKGSKIYLNNGDNTFTTHNGTNLVAFEYAQASLADFNNDGNLDIFITGSSGTSGASRLYRNDVFLHNIAPEAPSGLAPTVNGNSVTLKWSPVKGDATMYKGMSYNVKVGTTSGSSDVVSPLSLGNGTRLIPSMGNCLLDTFAILNKLKKGDYYWSVQAIDNGFKGGAFASEGAFSITSTGMEELDIPDAKLYPNPASDLVTLKNIPGKAEIFLYCIDGSMVKDPRLCENYTVINIKDLPTGLYIVKIKTRYKILELKLIKK